MPREIDATKRFQKDLKREMKGRRPARLAAALDAVLDDLKHDRPIAASYCDHPMVGSWRDFRDLHVMPDLVLIYRKTEDDRVELARLGSHSELKI